MRSMPWFAVGLVAVAAFAGCFGKDDDHGHADLTCPDGTVLHEEDFVGHDEAGFSLASHCPGGGSTTTTTTGAPRPNLLPVLELEITDDGGNATNFVMSGNNLTFDATGSTDPDGTLVGIAIVVQDANTTRAAALLANGQLTPAKFFFDSPGVVNVTVNLIDDRAGFTINRTHVYINHAQSLGSHAMKTPAPGSAATDCAGPAGNDIVDTNYYHEFGFEVFDGATFVEATVSASSPLATPPAPPPPTGATIAICTPDGAPISEEGDANVTSTNADPLSAPADPTKPYYVAAMSGFPQQDVAVSVIVHYEPRAAA